MLLLRRGVGVLGGDVLGPHEALDDLHGAVLGDGDEAAGDCDLLGVEHGAGFDRSFEVLQAGLEGLGFLDKLFGPRVVVHVAELVMAYVERVDLGRFLVGGVDGLGLNPAEAGDVRPADVDARFGPFPAGREFVGGNGEAVVGELVEQRGVFQPDAVLVLVGEEVANDGSAGGFVGVDADETGEGGGGGDALFRKHALDLVGARAVALFLDLVPCGELALAVGGDGEGLEGLQVELVGAECVQQLGCGIAEAKAPFHGAFGDAEAGGNVGGGRAGVGEGAEGLHLVGGVHVAANRVLGERDLGVGGAVVNDVAGNRMVFGDGAVGGQLGQGGEASAAGDDGEARCALGVGSDFAGDEVLEQSVGGDGGFQLDEGGAACGRLASVGGGYLKAVEGNRPDHRVGHESSPGQGWWGEGVIGLSGLLLCHATGALPASFRRVAEGRSG